VAPHAVEALKRLQPPDEPTNAESPHGLRLLNQLSNKDRHTRLPVVADGVERRFGAERARALCDEMATDPAGPGRSLILVSLPLAYARPGLLR
jgi:hypothetical protein